MLSIAIGGPVAMAAEPMAGDRFENSIKMKLAYIPPGEFEMGSPDSERDRDHNEKLHHVKLTKGFYLGVYEVTQAQYQRIMGRNPAHFSKDGWGKSEVSDRDTASFPVEQVSFEWAAEFCNALSKSEGLSAYYRLTQFEKSKSQDARIEIAENGGNGYRLPTEAEWEFACRAGTKTPFHFGDVLNGKDANVNGEYPYGTTTKGPHLNRTREVGNYAPNRFGLYDMHGNVREWCSDWYGEYRGDVVDPRGPESGEFRVMRGGSLNSLARYSRSAHRFGYRPPQSDRYSGFRVARTYP